MHEREVWITLEFCAVKIDVARASSTWSVVSDEPGRTDMFLSSSLFGKTEQKSARREQKQLYCFHAALILNLLVLRSSS